MKDKYHRTTKDQQHFLKPGEKTRGAKPALTPLEVMSLVLESEKLKGTGKSIKPIDYIANPMKYARRFVMRNRDALGLARELIHQDLIACAMGAGKHITDEKLKASSAQQLAVIRRESIYGLTLLQEQERNSRGAPSTVVNVMNILTERPVEPKSIQLDTATKIIKATKRAGKSKKIDTQNTGNLT